MAIGPGSIVEATKDCNGAIAGNRYVVYRAGSHLQIARECNCIDTWKEVGEGFNMKTLKEYFNKHSDT